ncbi:MAG TPA: ABC transporter substrate-binding protein [Acidimicrobiales bacterium]|jgi:ABC-type branched-subunit amino acid transport system substrate-binding protein|nr:ABC transporter substrate-binding protein [Acidimicrobiales bacterium]
MNGDSMRVRYGIRAALATVLAGTALAATIVVTTASDAGAQTSSAPGVTSNSITVGTISTQTGTLASNFGSLIYGERAYYDYINAQGGVNGRKINYQYALDDGGNPTTFNQLASTLINQDHVFAVTGVGTAFFSPNLFVESGIPTYGYNVTGNWAGAKNLFAAGGSVEYYQAGAPEVAYVARKTQAKPSIAFIAYGIAASSDACQAEQNAMQSAGYTISYSDLKVSYPGTTVATDVQRMKQAGTNFVASCMDVQGNVTMARAIQQYGAKITQLWFNGNDSQTLASNESLMQGVYFDISHVPFTAPQSEYAGLKTYLTEMNKYEPKYAEDEVALQGWESAALFVQGVKMAGNNLTQANVIKEDNSITAFTSGGLIAPINWKDAGHSGHAPPYCLAYIKVVGNKYVPTLNQGKNVINCFESLSPKKDPVFPLPAGTPSPS